MKVAIQGARGSFSEAAAARVWTDVELVPCREAAHVVAAVRDGTADAGILPVENSIVGSVTATWDVMLEAFEGRAMRLTEEVLLPVRHALLAPKGAEAGKLRRVLSHPVALGQCRRWLAAHAPAAELVAEWDTAGSAEIVAQLGDPAVAAIAPAAAAGALDVLADGIQDDPSNQTRFLAFSRDGAITDGPRKTSLVLRLDHRPGMLAAALQAFAARGVNLTSLQSRPEPAAPWTYRFYVDVEGDPAVPPLLEALESVEALAARAVVLGCYRAATPGAAPAPRLSRPEIPLHDRRRFPAGTVVRVGSVEIGGPAPILIAGPCSVESEEMIQRTATAVAAAGARMLRGGAFKPRTSPYDFQGFGAKGLRWLAEAGRRAGLPVVTEVMGWEDVPLVARHADMLQVGARNMQNFALLRALGRCGRPVLLKRGAGATVEEWLMAAEYVLSSGNPDVVLCERGIRTFERATRHTLDLNAVVLALQRTHLPVLVDPSHAAGLRALVPALAMAGLAAGAHGVIVEVHPDPDRALSDGAQSLDLEAFERLARRTREAG
ncbi:MAG: 3-deoxy-7-phosphoheptulonate synthase [Planctomycetes bacterium]|nr:3-deoxy-7-phosphoheptulonate synthase [Planctomycetota bacterium]